MLKRERRKRRENYESAYSQQTTRARVLEMIRNFEQFFLQWIYSTTEISRDILTSGGVISLRAKERSLNCTRRHQRDRGSIRARTRFISEKRENCFSRPKTATSHAPIRKYAITSQHSRKCDTERLAETRIIVNHQRRRQRVVRTKPAMRISQNSFCKIRHGKRQRSPEKEASARDSARYKRETERGRDKCSRLSATCESACCWESRVARTGAQAAKWMRGNEKEARIITDCPFVFSALFLRASRTRGGHLFEPSTAAPLIYGRDWLLFFPPIFRNVSEFLNTAASARTNECVCSMDAFLVDERRGFASLKYLRRAMSNHESAWVEDKIFQASEILEISSRNYKWR